MNKQEYKPSYSSPTKKLAKAVAAAAALVALGIIPRDTEMAAAPVLLNSLNGNAGQHPALVQQQTSQQHTQPFMLSNKNCDGAPNKAFPAEQGQYGGPFASKPFPSPAASKDVVIGPQIPPTQFKDVTLKGRPELEAFPPPPPQPVSYPSAQPVTYPYGNLPASAFPCPSSYQPVQLAPPPPPPSEEIGEPPVKRAKT